MSTRASRRALARRRFPLLAGSLARDFLPCRTLRSRACASAWEHSCASKLSQNAGRSQYRTGMRHPCTSALDGVVSQRPFVLLCLEANAFIVRLRPGPTAWLLNLSPLFSQVEPSETSGGMALIKACTFRPARPVRENPYRRAGRRLQQDLPSLVLLHFSESQRTTARGARKRVEVRLRPRIWLFRPKRSSS